jgi:hypothetical protein
MSHVSQIYHKFTSIFTKFTNRSSAKEKSHKQPQVPQTIIHITSANRSLTNKPQVASPSWPGRLMGEGLAGEPWAAESFEAADWFCTKEKRLHVWDKINIYHTWLKHSYSTRFQVLLWLDPKHIQTKTFILTEVEKWGGCGCGMNSPGGGGRPTAAPRLVT